MKNPTIPRLSTTPAGFDYQRYLASREWSLLRERVRQRSRDKCEHCFIAPQQAVHHLTYARLGHEELADLMAVCNPCHEWFSGKNDTNPAAIYVVSPSVQIPFFERLGFVPIHYLIPNPDKESSATQVHSVDCQSGCIWCSRAEEDWLIYLSHLRLANR